MVGQVYKIGPTRIQMTHLVNNIAHDKQCDQKKIVKCL